MKYIINDGTERDIKVGDSVKVIPGRLPPQFDGQFITIVDVSPSGPMASLESDQASVISPELITKAYTF